MPAQRSGERALRARSPQAVAAAHVGAASGQPLLSIDLRDAVTRDEAQELGLAGSATAPHAAPARRVPEAYDERSGPSSAAAGCSGAGGASATATAACSGAG